MPCVELSLIFGLQLLLFELGLLTTIDRVCRASQFDGA
jgi:hypothetical protein